MDLFINFLKRNKLLIVIGISLCIGISSGLIYSLNKYSKIEIPTQNPETIVQDVTSQQSGSVYDKYIDNQTEIDKENAEGTNFNAKRSATSINQAIYGLNDFLFDCYQNIKVDEVIATTKSGKEIYGLLNYDSASKIKEKLTEYVVNDNNLLNTVLTNYGFYIVKDKVGTLAEINSNVFWINKSYMNNITFSNDSIAEVEVPLYKSGSIPISAPIPGANNELTDSYGNKMGDSNTTQDNFTVPTAANYPGDIMIVKLIKQHGTWKIQSIEYK